MTSNLNYFYPYKNQQSFYNNDGSQIRIKEVIFKTQVPETSQPNQSTGGGGGITKVNYYYQLNNSQLNTNIVNFLDIAQDNTGNNPFRIIKEAYEAGLGLENGQSLNDFFFYDSYVMYGKSNSLGHPFYDYQNTTNIYNQIWMLESGNTENSITETQKAFGNKINWTEKYLNIDPVTQTQNSSAFIYTNRYKNVVPLTNPQKTDILNNPPTKFQ